MAYSPTKSRHTVIAVDRAIFPSLFSLAFLVPIFYLLRHLFLPSGIFHDLLLQPHAGSHRVGGRHSHTLVNSEHRPSAARDEEGEK